MFLTGKSKEFHSKLIEKHNGVQNFDRYNLIKQGWILGRTGRYIWNISNKIPVVSFWNNVKKNKKEIEICIENLIERNIIKDSYWLVAPGVPIQTIKEFMGGTGTGNAKPSFSPELLRKLHVMSPQAKKQIMDVNRTPKYINPMPGVRWWSPKSESFREWLNHHFTN